VTDLPPRIEAHVLPPNPGGLIRPDESVAVELCLFRLCDWQSVDVRASTREERDEAYLAHLRSEHADDLARLADLLDTPPPAPRITLNLGPPPEPEVRFVPVHDPRLRS
jgi:hypothetical protein